MLFRVLTKDTETGTLLSAVDQSGTRGTILGATPAGISMGLERDVCQQVGKVLLRDTHAE